MSRRLLSLAGSQARTAALVAAALVLGASGAMALTAPEGLLPTSGTTNVTEPVDPRPATPLADPRTDQRTDDVTADDEPQPLVETPEDDGSADGNEDERTADDEADDSDEVPDTAAVVSCGSERNHGEYVSGVARSTGPGPGHGVAVREAAHRDCGKDKDDDDPAAEEEAPEAQQPEVTPAPDTTKPDKPSKADKPSKPAKAGNGKNK